MAKLNNVEIDYSKYEPLRLDSCTVIVDVAKFLGVHRTVVRSYESQGKKEIATPYRNRGLLAVKRMKEIDEQEKK